jgi:hypothetical protein
MKSQHREGMKWSSTFNERSATTKIGMHTENDITFRIQSRSMWLFVFIVRNEHRTEWNFFFVENFLRVRSDSPYNIWLFLTCLSLYSFFHTHLTPFSSCNLEFQIRKVDLCCFVLFKFSCCYCCSLLWNENLREKNSQVTK